ncbi:MAG: hypothetical protein RLY30_551 [Pseudomonadota bacterium]|jgi:type VI secretion system lysozyme-like protein
MAKLGTGGKPLLFDRLSSSGDTVSSSGLGLAEVRMSIQHSLSVLSSTRSPRSLERYLAGELTTLDFGIPDFSSLSPGTESDRRLMARVMLRAINAFEPRLSSPDVRALPSSPQAASLMRFEIQATVKLQHLSERLSFELGVNRAQ